MAESTRCAQPGLTRATAVTDTPTVQSNTHATGNSMKEIPIIVVENDPFPRLLQAFLEAGPAPEPTAAIADFVAPDLPDFSGWLNGVRRNAVGLYPAEVRLASSQQELHEELPGAAAL